MKIGFLVYAAVIILFFPVILPADTLYFRSNQLGMAIEKLAPFQLDDFEYVLEVDEEGGKTMKKLIQEGREYKRWIIERNGEEKDVTLFEEGEIATVTRYKSGGKIDFIEYYSAGAVEEMHTYVYQNGVLIRIDVTGSNGELLYSNSYRRDVRGRLRQVKRSENEDERVSSYIFGSGKLVQEWHGTPSSGDLFRYNGEQEIESREEWADNSLKGRENYYYDDGRLVRKDYSGIGDETEIITWYNEENRKSRELRTAAGLLVHDRYFEYNDDGDILREISRTPGMKETWEYSYGSSSDLEEERYYRRDALVSVTSYVGDNEYYEVYYRDGVPFIRAHFIDEEKVEETLLIGPGAEETGMVGKVTE